MHNEQKKILFAVGGTGGHLFPAQAIAMQLQEQDPHLQVLFCGGRLSSNPFFDKERFAFREIKSRSPFQKHPLKALLEISKGIKESFKALKEEKPQFIVGFGSFYSFPLLFAALFARIPFILVETNAHPGRVNRLFSRKALFTAIQFEEASLLLKGKTELSKIPIRTLSWKAEEATLSTKEAKSRYGLDKERLTFLVFGGSQGASRINQAISRLSLSTPFQVIHLCGSLEEEELLCKQYAKQGVMAKVKAFEKNMQLAFKAADLVIARAGAGTLTELLAFELPSLLIPWPKAAENHQEKNAKAFIKTGGAFFLLEQELTEKSLREYVEKIKENLSTMKSALEAFNKKQTRKDLCLTILTYLQSIPL